MQFELELQVTALSPLLIVLLVFGELTMAHELPFQRSINVCVVLPVLKADPTAQQSIGDMQAMPVR